MSSIIILRVLQYVIIIFTCLLSYGDHLRGDFVFDDSVAIVKNSDVTNVETELKTLLSHDFWGYNITDPTSHKSYRPLTIFMFQLENRLFGMNPYCMKSVNFVLHTIISCFLIPFYDIVFEKHFLFGPSFLAALLFSVHPIHAEAVSGIVGRAELLTALFFVGTVQIYCLYLRTKVKTIFSTFSIFAIVFSMTSISVMCKETGITILATCAAIDILKCTKFRFQMATRIVTLFLMSLFVIFLRLHFINFESPKFRPMDNPLAASNNFLTRSLTQNYLYCINFWLFLCPDWLSFDWALGSIPLVESVSDYRIAFVVVFHSLFIFSLVLSKKREIFLSFSLIVIPFLPASGIIRLGFVIAERVLYIPSIGFCILISLGVWKLLKHFRKFKMHLYIAWTLVTIFFIFKTRSRSYEWTTEDLLFRSAIRVCPKNAKIYYNIARLSTDRNDKETAFSFYKKSIELHPEYEAAYMNLGNLYREIDEFETAEAHLKRSVEISVEFPAAWMNLGIVQAAMKKYSQALESYNKALSLRRNYPNCLYNIGNMYIDMKNTSMALKYWKDTLDLNPKHSKAWANTLALYDNKGRLEDIIKTSERALKYLPNDSAILFTRANAYGKIGNYQEAEHIYKTIISNRPDYALYHANLGVLYHRWNKKELATKYYKNALKIDPNLKSAYNNLMKLAQGG